MWICFLPIFVFPPLWFVVEIFFYLFFYRRKLSKVQEYVTPPQLTQQERQTVFRRIMNYLDSGEAAQQFLEEWFFDAQLENIQRENLREWMAWALHGHPLEKLLSEEEDQIEEMMISMETEKLGGTWRFPEGKNALVRSARLNLDPVMALPRPLLIYSTVALLDGVSNMLLWTKGFRKMSVRVVSSIGEESTLVYWHRAHMCGKGTKHPLVFFHGIGIGLISYHFMLNNLAGDRDIVLLQVPEVAMQHQAKPQVSPSIFQQGLRKIIQRHSYSKICAMGHSYGTVLVSWVLRDLREFVAGVVFLDPVCFLLFLPDVCMNFIYRRPELALSYESVRAWVVHYFAKRELGIAHTLQRHFCWYVNNTWCEDLCENVAVVLAERDEICPASAVSQYLKKHNKQRKQQGRQAVEVIWLPELYHADCVTSETCVRKVEEALASFP